MVNAFLLHRSRACPREVVQARRTLLDMVDAEVFVNFDVGATDQEIERVRAVFADIGIPATVTDQPYSLVASVDVDVADAFVVVATTVSSGFLGAVAAKAGSDAYEKLKRVVTGLRTARNRDRGRIDIIIRSEDGAPDLLISPDTPHEALGMLLTSELPPAPSGTLVYDLKTQRWTDADKR
jgi:hypothetical protein